MPLINPDSNPSNRAWSASSTPTKVAGNNIFAGARVIPGAKKPIVTRYITQGTNTTGLSFRLGTSKGGYIQEKPATTVKDAVQNKPGQTSTSPDVGAKPITTTTTTSVVEETRLKRLQPRDVPIVPPANPAKYDWNLPPHKWSLPINPALVNAAHFENNKITAPATVPDRYRRGRIWWKATPDIAVIDRNYTTAVTNSGSVGREFGFQFLWNPESFGTQVSVQLDATPSVQDRFLGVSGAFPATETISFTIRLDRTNDFACAATTLADITATARRDRRLADVITEADVENLKQFYAPNGVFPMEINWNNGGRAAGMSAKLVDLFQRGTLADIEYLYKAINGAGPGTSTNSRWLNGRGIQTADIGWLMPTLLHVDIGPLSYDGYVTALQVTHTSFTPSMVPIRSEVSISLNVLATAGLTTTNA